jgi:photosystem II stability/assembly factor-like uncharacterized protein
MRRPRQPRTFGSKTSLLERREPEDDMPRRLGLGRLGFLALGAAVAACGASADDADAGQDTLGSGGAMAGGGGAIAGSGGATAGSGGAKAGSGGATAGSGGAKAGSGGTTAGSGGATAGSGGAKAGSGGAKAGSGGAKAGSGGATGPADGGPPLTDAAVAHLPVGTWTDVTPAGSMVATGVYHIGVAPSDPAIVYVASDKGGMYKTTDAAKTWARLGNPTGYFDPAKGTDYLEDPCQIAVDPADPSHLYATEGVDGGRDGFWVSHDGGATWKKPQGFNDVASKVGGPGQDVVMMSVDPADFRHVIVSPHSDWAITVGYSSGILETRDGGDTWTYHLPPGDAWAAGTKGVHMLHHPPTGQGSGDTWLVCDENAGWWRTTDAGASWAKVSDAKGPHGGNESYYTTTGVLYVGAVYHPQRSTDNGVTWQSIDALPSTTYSGLVGTGSVVYVHGYTDTTSIPFRTTAESDGATWKADDGESGLTRGSSWEMRFDPTNRILYSANRWGGLFAKRVAP